MSRYEVNYAGRPIVIETGKMARQAHGSCTVRYGDTVVLVTACRNDSPSAGVDFLPLTVNYMEMTYAAGKIPGGFFKREGRPSEKEVLGSRLIDRPLRPLFPEGYYNETQIVATVLSVDLENDPEIAAMIGASAALGISDVPFGGPIAGVRIGSINGELVANPSLKQQKESDLDLFVAAKEGSIIMVEAGAKFVNEDFLVKALAFAQETIQPVLDLQKQMATEAGKPKMELKQAAADPELEGRVRELAEARLKDALKIPVKQERYGTASAIKKDTLAALAESFPGREKEIDAIYGDLKYRLMREMVIN